MTQAAIPYLMMRGGTSRGPVFLREDLPRDRAALARVLARLMGTGTPLNIDGIGGGASVTTKVAMLSRSARPGCDVDYLFAQVNADGTVDMRPTCGNMLVAVGPAAIEMGLVPPRDAETAMRVHAVNTGAEVDAVVQTPAGRVSYAGGAAIDGVPGTAAPVALRFRGVVGALTGRLLPTGSPRDRVAGTDVTCIDVAVPMVLARAESFGLSGHEGAEALESDRALLARVEAVRIEAGRRMGLEDVPASVTPKFGLLAPARAGGHAAVRYFTPWSVHPTLAVTGSQAFAAALLLPGAVAEGLADLPPEGSATVRLEHPAGTMDVCLDYGPGPTIRSAGLTRTCRKLAAGQVFLPGGALAT
ncbi:MAG: PrpF domain-containing protein [Pseudomonadota bacterium]